MISQAIRQLSIVYSVVSSKIPKMISSFAWKNLLKFREIEGLSIGTYLIRAQKKGADLPRDQRPRLYLSSPMEN